MLMAPAVLQRGLHCGAIERNAEQEGEHRLRSWDMNQQRVAQLKSVLPCLEGVGASADDDAMSAWGHARRTPDAWGR